MQETTARVQFDKKYLIALVLPLVIEQVLAVTVGMADMIMVSGAGDTAVSGVSLVNTISNLLIYIFNALATGGAVVAAQALGAKKKKTGQIVANQLVLSRPLWIRLLLISLLRVSLFLLLRYMTGHLLCFDQWERHQYPCLYLQL